VHGNKGGILACNLLGRAGQDIPQFTLPRFAAELIDKVDSKMTVTGGIPDSYCSIIGCILPRLAALMVKLQTPVGQ